MVRSLNSIEGSQIVYSEADEDSREARAAERAGRVKTRVKSSADKAAKKPSRAEKTKRRREETDEEEAPRKKKKKRSRG